MLYYKYRKGEQMNASEIIIVLLNLMTALINLVTAITLIKQARKTK
jgi:hypothetical protein